jgi:hypothetical protein
MLVPHRKHTYRPARPGTMIPLLFTVFNLLYFDLLDSLYWIEKESHIHYYRMQIGRDVYGVITLLLFLQHFDLMGTVTYVCNLQPLLNIMEYKTKFSILQTFVSNRIDRKDWGWKGVLYLFSTNVDKKKKDSNSRFGRKISPFRLSPALQQTCETLRS